MDNINYLDLSKDGLTVYECRSNCEGKVVIPNGVTEIYDHAFKNCDKVTSVEIPNSVTRIGKGAFDGCSNLTSINIPFRVTEINDGTFYGCFNLKSIFIPNGITSIGASAFAYCVSLTSIEIPSSVSMIRDFAFAYCASLTSLDVPECKIEIWGGSFDGCSKLKQINLNENITNRCSQDGVVYSKDMSTLIVVPAGRETIEIPSCMDIIGTGAFAGCTELKQIFVEKGNTTFCSKDGVLYSKDMSTMIVVPGGKRSITIPNSVNKVYNNTFENCIHLTSIEVPSNLTDLGTETFNQCTGLMEIIVNDKNPNYCSKDGVLYSKDMKRLIAVPDGIKSIKIPDGVIEIEYYALWGCTNLVSIEIPESVTEFGYIFSECKSLKEIHFKHISPLNFHLTHPLIKYPFDVTKLSIYVPKGAGEAYLNSKYYPKIKKMFIEE